MTTLTTFRKALAESDAYDKDRFLIVKKKGGKSNIVRNTAVIDNPKHGEKDGPMHVWAETPEDALKQYAAKHRVSEASPPVWGKGYIRNTNKDDDEKKATPKKRTAIGSKKKPAKKPESRFWDW